MIAPQFSDQIQRIAQVLSDEFEQMAAGVRNYLFSQHHEDGTHSDVTADTIEADSVTVVESSADPEQVTGRVVVKGYGGPNGHVDSTLRTYTDPEGTGATHVLRQGTEAQEYHVDLPSGRAMALGVVSGSGAATEQRFLEALTALGSLRLAGQSSYAASANDTAAFADESDGPAYTCYRMTHAAARTIDGIYADLTVGNRGQVLIAWNDTVYPATFQSVVVSNARKILGDPVTIGPQGVAIFLYDVAAQGWRIISHSFGDSVDYTPVWSSTGTQPALGDGTLTGKWRDVGGVIHYEISLTPGASTTFGTGTYKFTLPVSALGTNRMVGSAKVEDSGVAYYLAMPVTDDAGAKIFLITTDGGGQVQATSPFTFGVSDNISIGGSYARR